MELQFHNKPLRCMRQVAWDTKNEEQTLEIRVTDDMPAVDKILAVWGQPVIRSKEWNGDLATVSGGVLAWVLYDGQNGEGPQKVEGWIPFQFKWNLEDSSRDGVFHTQWLLRSIDARLTGAGKLMVRASVSALGQGMEETDLALYRSGELPEDVQTKTEQLTICIPAEAGEKVMLLDEELVIPPGGGEVGQVLAYMLRPAITEKKLMADKFVFRGVAKLQTVYIGTDGRIHAFESDVPISQYTQLEQEYGPDAHLRLLPEISELELEKLDGGRLRLKGSIVGQYSVWDSQTLEIVTDAYSNRRTVELQTAHVSLPNMIGEEIHEIQAQCRFPGVASETVAGTVCVSQPNVKREEDCASAVLEGTGQMIFYDGEGKLCSESKTWETKMELAGVEDPQTTLRLDGYAVLDLGADDTGVVQKLALSVTDIQNKDIEMVSGLSLGELEKPDPSRPSLMLCSTGGRSLWEIAKELRSKVSDICAANDLEGEPDPKKMLVIPVE